MTDRLTALEELKAKVEAGEWDDFYDQPSEVTGLSNWHTSFDEAYNGSLDAALALKDATLPEWVWLMKTVASGGVRVWMDSAYVLRSLGVVAMDSAYVLRGLGVVETAETPARAWLLAILSALIEQEKADG